LIVVVLISVSFFKLSGIIDVSFRVVSFVVFVIESAVVTESVLADPFPLQAATDVATAKAKRLILNEFFIVWVVLVLSNCT